MTGPAASRPLSASGWRLKRVLRVAALILLAATASLLVVHEIGSVGGALREPPWVGGMAAAGFLLTAVAVFAAGDPRRRIGLAWILAGSLVAAAGTQLAYLIAGAGGGRPLGAETTTSDLLMWWVAGAELALATVVMLAARSVTRAEIAPPPELGWWSSSADSGLRPILGTLGAVASVAAAAAAIGPFAGPLRELFSQPLISAHIAAGAVAASALCWYVAAEIRDRLALVAAPAVALAAGAVVGALSLRHAAIDQRIEVLGATQSARGWLVAGIGAALALALALAVLRRRAFRARLGPGFLGATEYRALMALADVIVEDPDRAVPPARVAANVDRYFGRIRARRKHVHRAGLVAVQLHPLLTLKAPFSELDEESRLRHLETRFHQAVLRKRFPPEPLRRYTQVMLRMANQLTYIGYYSDPGSFESVGYQPFSRRARFAELDRAGKIPAPGPHPLEVTRAPDLEVDELEADYCVIGSGAAGAILAHELAEAGTVIVLERGEYVEPREFTDDEVEMIGRLYGDGVFQQSEDFRFTVLQGSCVGGSTVVNNAVSIPLPPETLHRWNERHGAGIDPEGFRRSTDAVERWLRIERQDEGPNHPDLRLNPSYPKFLAGVEHRFGGNPSTLDVSAVPANLDGCLGCGYCNIGCRYGKKLSMLDTVLPAAQRAHPPGRVRILAECEVTGIAQNRENPREASAAEVKLPGRRRLKVRARKFAVAAGAVGSPYLLQRSGIGKGLPVGRHASFNMGAPLTAEFEENLDAYDGLQISHVGVPRSERGWVLETWWNPPVAQALNMPGWFDSHYENMRRYRRLMAVGALVGTERNARIDRAALGGPAVHYVPTPGDLRKLADGLIELGQILFAAGARAVMVNGWEYLRFTSPNGLYELPGIMRDPTQVTLGTGHPQGGNAISSDPGRGVVDPDFKVHGYTNVYVCDASVFPTSITVNPQLTVMALAHYAAPRIAGDRGG